MKAYDSGPLPFIKVTEHSITNLLAQTIKIISFSKDRRAKRSRRVTTFRGILH